MSLPAKHLARSVFVLLLAQSVPAQRENLTLGIEREIIVRSGSSHSLAWAPDGKRIASGGECGDVLVVDADTGRVVHELLAADHWIGALRFSPDGRSLFVGGRDLTRWDLRSGELTARAAIAHATPVALTRDGARIASAADNSTVELRKASDFELVGTLAVPDDTAIDGLAFDRDGTRLAVGKRSGKTYVFAVASGDIVEQLGRSGWVRSLEYLDDNSLVRLGEKKLLGFTNRVEAVGEQAWGMAIDPRARLCLTWNHQGVRGFSREGPSFVVSGPGPAAIHSNGTDWVRARDHMLEFHRGEKLGRRLPLPHRARPGATVFVGDGKHLAIGTHVFDLTNGAAVPIPDGVLLGQPIPYAGGAELAMWQEPRFFDEVGTLSLWSIAALCAGRTTPVREHRIVCKRRLNEVGTEPVFSGDGLHFTLADTVRDALRPETVHWRAPEKFQRTLQPRPDGDSVWGVTHSDSGCIDGYMTLQLLSADGENGPEREFWFSSAMAWSPDCSRLAIRHMNGAFVIDAESGTTLVTLPAATAEWVDNDTLLLCHDGKLELVSIPTGSLRATLELPCKWAELTIAAGGKRAAVVAHDRVIVVRIGGD